MVPRVRTFLLILCLLVTGASAAMPSESSPRPYLRRQWGVRLHHPSGIRICESHELHRIPGLRRARLDAERRERRVPRRNDGKFSLGDCARPRLPRVPIASATALSFLAKHRRTRLVTILLGANDLFLLEDACAGDQTCIANGLPQVLATISANIATILGEIRASGYKGLIVVENYYSLDYSDAAGTTLMQLLNQAVSAPAASFGAVVADVFSAFEIAATNPFAGGNTCKAGLLNASPQNQFLCDVHPSQSGQRLIARAVEAAFTAALQAAE